MRPQVYWPPDLLGLWARIYRCRKCQRDPGLDGSGIEWDRYVPLKTLGILPPGRRSATYVLVAAEPSGDWVKTRRRTLARQRMEPGLRNFSGSTEDLVLQFAIERWLLDRQRDEGYYITDLGKCTLPVAQAPGTRQRRVANCSPFLEAEIELLRPRVLIAVGRPAFAGLLRQRRKGWPAIFEISHYGKAGQGYWGRYLRRGWEAKVPRLDALERWMEERFQLSLHKDPLKPPNAMHLRLLGTYRRQFKDIRELLDAKSFAISGTVGKKGMRFSIASAEQSITSRAAWLVDSARRGAG